MARKKVLRILECVLFSEKTKEWHIPMIRATDFTNHLIIWLDNKNLGINLENKSFMQGSL